MTTHTLANIALSALVPTRLNVRKHGDKGIDTLAASIRSIGLLQPLVVRETPDGTFAVIAGARRHRALIKLMRETPEAVPATIPCVTLAAGDDALAIEASLAENIARADMDEIDQYTALAALIKNGHTPEQAAAAFGISSATLNKRLALSRLVAGIHAQYRTGAISVEALRLLTLASRPRQTEYLELLASNKRPADWQLRAWVLGSGGINTTAAVFDRPLYTGPITTDLFAEEQLFADAEMFWSLQNQAIAALRDQLAAAGWSTVTVLDPSSRFQEWDYAPTTKSAGGHTIIEVEADGAVTVHKGLLPNALARAATKSKHTSGGADAPVADRSTERPELSEPLAAYIDTVRLHAVRADLIKTPKIALRLLLAHLAGGATNLSATAQSLPALADGVSETLDSLPMIARMSAARETARELAGRVPSEGFINAPYAENSTAATFARLCAATDVQVMAFAAVIMAETLAIGADIVDVAGAHLGSDVTASWQPSSHLLDLVRDTETTAHMLDEVIGTTAAASYTASTGRAKRDIIAKALAGDGREQVTGWQPKWMRFPAHAYTTRRRTSRGSRPA